MLVLFLDRPREERRSCWRYQCLGYQSAFGATAVPELLYLETTAAKWLFLQEKATSYDFRKDM
jgi:hypothetical protein